MRMQVVDRSGEVLRIEPFSVETAATVFEPRPVAVVAATAVAEFLPGGMGKVAGRNDGFAGNKRYSCMGGVYSVAGGLLLGGGAFFVWVF